MSKSLRILSIISVVVSLIISVSCSGNKNAIEPQTDMPVIAESFGMENSGNHSMVAAYYVVIDPEAMTLTIEPVNERSVDYHFPLSTMFPNVLAITGYGFDPSHNNDFFADVRLTHPYPGSGINGLDPRLIAILPAKPGAAFYYPATVVGGNNKVLMNADAYTGLYDNVGGSIPGNVNPFIAYFTDQPYNVWYSYGVTEQTKRLYIDLDGFGGSIQFVFVVDVCTAYPEQSQPYIHNAPEPVSIAADITSDLTQSGGSALVEVTLKDWQGADDIICKLECPELFDSTVTMVYDRPGLNLNEYIFTATITNDKGATPGDYDMLIAAQDVPTGVRIFNETEIHVGYEPSAWSLDPVRANIDLTKISDMFPPKPGSDLGVIDNADPSIGGILMYEPEDMVVKLDLDLTTCVLHGYSYMPQDNDPTNPHPEPLELPAGRIDAQENGYAVQSFIDGHLGAGPDLAGQFQREDSLIAIMKPDNGWLDFLIAAMPNMANDNPQTPDYDESEERPRLTDVYEEYEVYGGKYTFSGIWSGTVVWDVMTGDTFNPIGVMGGLKKPYYTDPFIVMDWGLWIFTGPPSNEIQAADASQDLYYPFQYWGYSGRMTGNALIGQYDKYGATMAAFQPSNLDAKLLDIELIPRQDPPLEINGIVQDIDWVVILLDNKTIEILDPYMPPGQIVDIIDLYDLNGEPKYLDVRNTTAEIFISHTDGVIPYCSVYTLN